MADQPGLLYAALEDFFLAHRKAKMSQILARLRGGSVQLLSFEEVRSKLRQTGSMERGLQDIPLSAIVGSVGRYQDFTRDFLPLRKMDRERWARVKAAVSSMEGVPPIDVYKIGEVYFVRDGNHRVSVAREFGATHIQASVIEVRTRVPLAPNTSPDEFILKTEYADFLERTHLDELRPEADLTLTAPGKYEQLLEQIAFHHYDLTLDSQAPVSYEQAIGDWYDHIFLPVVEIIREQGILRYFPGRSEADLYLWIVEHRDELEKNLVWEVKPTAAASDLVGRYSRGARKKGIRLRGILPKRRRDVHLEPAFSTRQWFQEKLVNAGQKRLFNDVLVPLSGKDGSWVGLDQAIVIAQREQSRLYGLHVTAARGQKGREAAQEIENRFKECCAEAGVPGYLVPAEGEIIRQICARAGWMDLVVANLARPGEAQQPANRRNRFSRLVQSCPSPLFITPEAAAALNKAMLVYDGSPRSEEALYIAAYLAGQWKIPLVVLQIQGASGAAQAEQERVESYLSSLDLTAQVVRAAGPAVALAAMVAEEYGCDFIIAGGYDASTTGAEPLAREVEQALYTCRRPVLLAQ